MPSEQRKVASKPRRSESVTEPLWFRCLLTGIALGFLGLLLILPLTAIFLQAFEKGWDAYWSALSDSETLSSIRLTLLIVAIALPINTVFGVAAAWAISKFEFPGKNLLTTLIDLPYSVSPVIAGMIFVLLFAPRGYFGPWLEACHIQIIFAVPGMILVTLFVTFPFVARELIPLMQSQGIEEEEAARALGAGGWKIFWYVTLPNIKWGLLYGVILCNARCMGEFGAVSVVAGVAMTLTLRVEDLYKTDMSAAFAVASMLMLLGVVTLVLKSFIEWKTAKLSQEEALGYCGD
jgi:sulfate/thiosulfate transport system permease protein